MIIFGKRLKELRIKNNMTQEELGNLINISKVSISFYEKRNRKPSIETLIDLANVFKVDLDYLIGTETYIISDNMENYGMRMSKEEIDIIRELRRHKNLHRQLIEEPKRMIELIEKKIN